MSLLYSHASSPELDSLSLYCRDIRSIVHSTTAEETLINGCLGYVLRVARTYATIFPTEEYVDLVSIGNLAAVECCGAALTKHEPKSYLRGCIKRQIYYYCVRHKTVYELKEPAHILSINEEEERNYGYLYDAMELLPFEQKELIRLHFGLGIPKQSLYERSRSMSPNSKGTIAYGRLYAALRHLRKLLESNVCQNRQEQ